MRFFTSLTAISLLLSSALALPTESNEHASSIQERQSGLVLTVANPFGNVLPRKEIRQLKDQNLDQWTLFVLALRQWYKGSQASQTSYFGMGNIHGVPVGNYNGVGACGNCGSATGYGVHDNVLFPTWHRAYIATFEQQMVKVAKTIANSYPASAKNGWTRSRMVNAANQLRMPYWDWAAMSPQGRQVFPQMFTDTKVTLQSPTGRITVTNPLFTYDRINDPSGMVYSPFINWKKTYRWPSDNGNNPSSLTQTLIGAFGSQRQNLQDQVYGTFTQCSDYLHWSNDEAGSSSTQCATSIESIHNNVHNLVGGQPNMNGGGGHMTYLPLSAFDPLFYLHHCNVDRYFAMWQRLHPNSYVGSQSAPSTSWTIAQGDRVDIDTPLTPFYKDNKRNFWTSRQVQDWTVFGYTYPEFSNSDGSAASIATYVNNLYGPNANKIAGSSKRDVLDERQVIDKIMGTVNDVLPASPLRASNGSVYQYVANIAAPRNALGGTYTIFLFNGQPTTSSDNFYIDPKLIGPVAVTSSAPGGTAMASSVSITGSVPLTRTLQNLVSGSLLQNLAEALVGPYLTNNLVVKIVGPKGEDVDPSTLEGFTMEVAASTAEQSNDPSVLPVFSDFVKLLSFF